MTDNLVLLTAIGAVMTKTFTPAGVTPYDAGWRYHYDSVDVDDVFDLSRTLLGIEDMPSTLVIRGELLETVDPAIPVLRRKDAYDGERAYFRQKPAGRRWMMVDFDKVPAPGDLLPEERLEYLVSTLPDYMHDVTYHYQWSASAGVAGWDLLSCHLWFWLEEPRTDEQLGWWAQEVDVDDAVMRTVQPNYTARPIFKGVDDPLPGARSGLVRKPKHAAPVPATEQPAPLRTPHCASSPRAPNQRVASAFDDYLAVIGDRLHMPIQRAVCAWLASTNSNTDKDKLKQRLREAISASSRGDKLFYMRDAYLDQCIRSAQRKVSYDPHGPRHVPETDMERMRAKLTRKYRGHSRD